MLIGLIVRRTVPAMAITLAIFAVVQIAMPVWIRPHLITPVRSTTALTASVIQGLGMNQDGQLATVFAPAPSLPGAWIYSNQVVTPSGSTTLGSVPQACQQGPGSGRGVSRPAPPRSRRRTSSRWSSTSPPDRYWTFQWLELGIFLTVAILLAWGCFWWVRRRLS